MNTYRVLRVKEAMTSISGKKFTPIHGDFAFIGDYPWGGGKRQALGLQPDGFTVPSAEYMEGLDQYVFIR